MADEEQVGKCDIRLDETPEDFIENGNDERIINKILLYEKFGNVYGINVFTTLEMAT